MTSEASHAELQTPARALAISAHPDDTEFGCSGTLAKWIAAGCEVHYLLLTSGDKGTDDPNADLEALRQTREREQEAAAKLLGVKSCTFLRLNDGELVNSLELRGLVVREIRRRQPEVILTWDPLTRIYRMHPDHRVCGQVALEAAFPAAMMPLSYPQQLRDEGLSVHRTKKVLLYGTDAPDHFVDIGAFIDTKVRSLRQHASQIMGGPGDLEKSIQNRARLVASNAQLPFEYAEGFKLVEISN